MLSALSPRLLLMIDVQRMRSLEAGELRVGFVGFDIHRGRGKAFSTGKSQRQRHRGRGRGVRGREVAPVSGLRGQQGQVSWEEQTELSHW